MKHHKNRRIHKSRRLGFGLAVAAAGIILLSFALAAEPPVSFEAENANISGASVVNLIDASGGKALKFSAGQPKYKSIISYPGWEHDEIPPDKIDYSPYTGVFHFGHYPTSTGGVALADMQSTSNRPKAIAAAHNAGRKIYVVIGGEDTGAEFESSAKSTYRSKFINSMLNIMRPDGGYKLSGSTEAYYYDGLIIDWEERLNSNTTNQDNYVALVKETYAALNDLAQAEGITRPHLGVDVISGLNPPSVVTKFDEQTDSINIMSYWSDWESEHSAYSNAGIPSSKMILGIGLSSDYYDTSQERVQAKVDFVKANGLQGLEGWQIGDLNGYNNDPRLMPLRNLVN